jgi:putative DNA primase/helicase
MEKSLKELKQDVNIYDFINPRITGGLKRNGPGKWKGICPFHSEKTPSFTVHEGKRSFKCFGCGESGDVFDFLIRYGETLKEAIAIVNGGVGAVKDHKPADFIPLTNVVEWTQIKPVPDNAPNPDFRHYQLGDPINKWAYRDLDGKLLGYICRYMDGKKKETRPLTFRANGKYRDWRWKGFDDPKPLYNLPDFRQKPGHAVLIVEGEKAADAARYLFQGKKIVTTWPFGSQSTKHVDWSPLTGKDVYLWPDNDKTQKYDGKNDPRKGQIKPFEEQPGNKAMLEIYEQIKDLARTVKWIKNSPNFADKWDVADVASIWTEEETQKYFNENITDVPGTGKKKTTKSKPVDPPPPVTQKAPAGNNKKLPYKVLGFEKMESGPPRYHFYSYETNMSVSLRPDQMKEVNLTAIANLNYWTMEYPGRKDGVDLKSVVNTLVTSAHEVGVISFDDYRGRGAWMDENRIIIHAGDHVIVDGKKLRFSQFNSRNIYEQARPMDIDLSKHLDVTAASKVLDLCKMLSWERPQNAHLLAGWIVVAPICGVLPWRPHVQITGGSGVGKSTVMQHIIKPLIKNVACVIQGSSTEAGIRQRLKYDAIPVLFDELDSVSNSKDDDHRQQQIIGLVRASSSTDGGDILKGSTSGSSASFTIKACFAFAGIKVPFVEQQDRSRVSLLGLVENKKDPDKLVELHRDITMIITENYAKQLQARTITHLRTLLENIKIFSKAVTVVLGNHRTGDQVGALLAGAYMLEHDDVCSFDYALEFVKTEGFDWSEEMGVEQTRHEIILLQHIMEQVFQMENANGVGSIYRNISEMIKVAVRHSVSDDEMDHNKCDARLRRLGIKVDDNYIVISNSSPHIKKMLDGTGFSKNYNKLLLRLPGAWPVDSTSFTSDLRTRAVKIPLAMVSEGKVIEPRTPQQVRAEMEQKERDEREKAKNENNNTGGGAITPLRDDEIPF